MRSIVVAVYYIFLHFITWLYYIHNYLSAKISKPTILYTVPYHHPIPYNDRMPEIFFIPVWLYWGLTMAYMSVYLPSIHMRCGLPYFYHHVSYLKVGFAHKATTFLLHAHHTSTSHPSIHYITTLHYNNRNKHYYVSYNYNTPYHHSTGRGYCTILLYDVGNNQHPPAPPIAHNITTINNK